VGTLGGPAGDALIEQTKILVFVNDTTANAIEKEALIVGVT
jgi:hypothetical protein